MKQGRLYENVYGDEGPPPVDDTPSSDGDVGESATINPSFMVSSASVQASVHDLIEEHGRTYQRNIHGKYPLPNDSAEQQRLNTQHALCNLTFHGKLYFAPIEGSPKNVLDVATGTGIWAIEFATQHPNSTVLGTDLASIQPSQIPPNCHFQISNAESEWSLPAKFDFVHGRGLVTCFTDPRFVIRQAFDSLAPGGYLELQDAIFPMQYVGPPPVDSPIYKWNEYILSAARKSGRPWDNVVNYAKWMGEIGFEGVEEKNFYWPTNPWPKGRHHKMVSVLFQEDFMKNLEALSMKILTSQLGWTAEEVKTFVGKVVEDWRDTSIHAYTPIKVVYGRKPVM